VRSSIHGGQSHRADHVCDDHRKPERERVRVADGSGGPELRSLSRVQLGARGFREPAQGSVWHSSAHAYAPSAPERG